MSFKQSRKSQRPIQGGFTLIELMVAITVLAIVVAVAVPSFTDMINNYRSVSLAEDFVSGLNFARSEAVKRGTNVSVCASSNGTDCAGANNWSDGWIAFTDGAATEKAGAPVVNTVLRSWSFEEGNAVINVNQNAATNFLRFTGMGILGRFTPTTINSKVSGCTGDSARSIGVARSGVISIAKASCE
ncbi:GspH/FimT family pseudopilin [Microbulbifer sp. GL-2]|uniref:GspH/FimT family pseudopilin n=1 Tax=Microbulbifer sp. GL-2 TaxID=2591606 RepID=UPI00117CBA35|nr:GspH/FimT family pseudopilin [Microbulbifer sp. GL-2]